jgi:hypothetical protein
MNITVFAANAVSRVRMPETTPAEEAKPAVDDETEGSHRDSKIPLQFPEQPVTGTRFNALPREEQAMLRRAHQNLCHPSPEQLSAVLRSQGARPELTQAAFEMKCSACAAHQKPKLARPSAFKSELDFNDKIFRRDYMDKQNGQEFYHIHVEPPNKLYSAFWKVGSNGRVHQTQWSLMLPPNLQVKCSLISFKVTM